LSQEPRITDLADNAKRQAVCETWQGLSQEPRITDLADNAKFKRCKVLNYFS